MVRKRPSKIVCVGRNYAAHAEEFGSTVPEQPLLFFKPPSSLVGDGDAIQVPNASKQVEHEGEIGVVMGKTLRRANKAATLSGALPSALLALAVDWLLGRLEAALTPRGVR